MRISILGNFVSYNVYKFGSLLSSILSVTLQGFCPGLTHGQKFGISYVHSRSYFRPRDDETDQPKEPTTVKSHALLVLPDQSPDLSPQSHNSDQNGSQTQQLDASAWSVWETSGADKSQDGGLHAA